MFKVFAMLILEMLSFVNCFISGSSHSLVAKYSVIESKHIYSFIKGEYNDIVIDN